MYKKIKAHIRSKDYVKASGSLLISSLPSIRQHLLSQVTIVHPTDHYFGNKFWPFIEESCSWAVPMLPRLRRLEVEGTSWTLCDVLPSWVIFPRSILDFSPNRIVRTAQELNQLYDIMVTNLRQGKISFRLSDFLFVHWTDAASGNLRRVYPLFLQAFEKVKSEDVKTIRTLEEEQVQAAEEQRVAEMKKKERMHKKMLETHTKAKLDGKAKRVSKVTKSLKGGKVTAKKTLIGGQI